MSHDRAAIGAQGWARALALALALALAHAHAHAPAHALRMGVGKACNNAMHAEGKWAATDGA
jgi:hypothetical protein